MRIGTQLWLLAGFIVAGFAVVVLFVAQSFLQTKELASELVNSHLDKVVENSRHARNLAMISARIKFLSSELCSRDHRLVTDAQQVQRELSQLALSISDESLRSDVERYGLRFDDYLAACIGISRILEERRSIDESAHATLDGLESTIINWLTQSASQGDQYDHIDQLLELVSGYRESLLRVGLRFAEQEGPNAFSSTAGERSAQDDLDDLYLRLQTITASKPQIVELGLRLTTLVDQYREIIVRMRLRVQEWRGALAALQEREAESMAIMAAIDDTTVSRAKRAGLGIEHLINRTRDRVILLASLVIALVTVTVAYVIRYQIQTPLRAILRALSALPQGPRAEPLDLRLKNEWGAIEKALDTMNRELAHSYATIRESEERYRMLIDHQGDMVVKVDTEGRFLYVSPTYCETFGKREDELLGRRFMPLVHEDDRASTAKAMEALDSPPHTAFVELRAVTRQGWRWQAWSNRAVVDEQNRVVAIIGVGRDITAEKERRNKLERAAYYDALTKLPNRVLLADRLRQAMLQVKRRGARLALAFIDLDGFKKINDSYGHDAGDRYLVAVSKRLQEALRDGDTIARLGGDEFVALLIDISPDDECTPFLERFLAVAADEIDIDGHRVQTSVSVGVTYYPQVDPIDADHLLRQADQAMYQAKLSGKNCYRFYDPEQERGTVSVRAC